MFVPGLVRRLIEVPCFDGPELRLMDIDDRRLAVMENLAGELVAAEGRKLAVTSATDRLRALRGVDFVISAISVGGMAAWANDIDVPARYGVFRDIADSIGPGGIFRARRDTPVVAAMARELAEVAPARITTGQGGQ
jgi:alpha-galactosidase